jgi:hypothetical protein
VPVRAWRFKSSHPHSRFKRKPGTTREQTRSIAIPPKRAQKDHAPDGSLGGSVGVWIDGAVEDVSVEDSTFHGYDQVVRVTGDQAKRLRFARLAGVRTAPERWASRHPWLFMGVSAGVGAIAAVGLDRLLF